jgi:RNA polymerase sigma-70 factor (ECF subfamily)
MPPDDSFHDLVQKVRAGDDAAAAELVRRFGPALRRAVRARLSDRNLRRLLDSMDICQSVLASFFVRAAAGQYDLATPGQLVRLLAVMARHKLLRQAEKLRAARRDCGRDVEGGFGGSEPADNASDPSRVAAGRELLALIRGRLPEEERWSADQRLLGRSWADIAAEVGCHADALRMRLSRAIDRVARELGIDV